MITVLLLSIILVLTISIATVLIVAIAPEIEQKIGSETPYVNVKTGRYVRHYPFRNTDWSVVEVDDHGLPLIRFDRRELERRGDEDRRDEASQIEHFKQTPEDSGKSVLNRRYRPERRKDERRS